METTRFTPPRLSIYHPEYRYPASFNPYWSKCRDYQGRIYSDNETEKHPGQWRAQFLDSSGPAETQDTANRRPLHLEIGCNGGHVILEWAKRNPLHAYIGLDWKFKQIYLGSQKADRRGIRNLMFFRSHAQRLKYMFAPGEIDHLYLYFPDPWPKNGHWKNRFVNAENLKMLAALVRRGGTFEIKTDHPGYFEWMEKALRAVHAVSGELWRTRERSTDLHAGHPNPIELQIPDVTIFEKVFIRQSIPIHRLLLERS